MNGILNQAPSENVPYRKTGFMRPADVIGDNRLTLAEKREILASWASDVRVVPDMPALRQLDNGAVVHIDDVLVALKSLDDGHKSKTCATSQPVFRRSRGRSPWRLKSVLRRNWFDDDEDPPPCPATAARPPGGPLSGGDFAAPDLMLAA